MPPTTHLTSRPRHADAIARRSDNLVSQFGEATAKLLNRHQPKRMNRDSAWKQRFSLTQSDRTDLNDELVEQACVVELARQVATAHDPDVFVARSPSHFGVYRLDISPDKS